MAKKVKVTRRLWISGESYDSIKDMLSFYYNAAYEFYMDNGGDQKFDWSYIEYILEPMYIEYRRFEWSLGAIQVSTQWKKKILDAVNDEILKAKEAAQKAKDEIWKYNCN